MFIPIANKRFKTNKRKTHTSQCPKCKTRSKSIIFHYKINHPEILDNIESSISSGYVGEVSGFRFLVTARGDIK